VPELYDVVQDPREEKNLVYLQKKAYEDLKARAESLIGEAGRDAYETDVSKLDEETREKLAALGYIGSFQDPAKLEGRKLANPREKIGVFNELSRAREMGMGEDADKAVAIIKDIIASDPDIVDAYFSIGNIYFQHQRFAEAIDYFKQVLGRKPDDSFAAINVALSYEGLGRYDDAEVFVLDYLKTGVEDSQLYFLLGNMNFTRKQYDKAVGYFEKCLAGNTESAASHNVLAAIAIIRDDLASAEGHLREATRINPKLSNIRYNRAQIYEKQGRFREAEEQYLEELELSPKHFKAAYNLSRLYRRAGDEPKEYQYLERCLDIDPGFPLTYFYLARIYLNRGERYQDAVDLVKKGIELKPEESELPLGYFLLADLYNRLGNQSLSQDCARKGEDLAARARAGR
jgi:tetratricopeptide (TPR) repeat protein